MKILLSQEESVRRIKGCIDKIVDLETLSIKNTDNSYFKEFELKTRRDLKEIFGERSDEFTKFDEIKFKLTSKMIGMEDYSIEQQQEEAFIEGIGEAKELLIAIMSLLETEQVTCISKGDQMTKNHSSPINIQGHGNVVNFGNGNVQNSASVKEYLESLKEKIDSSGQTQEEKSEAKGILEKVTSNPLLISILGSSIPELIKLFSNQS